VEQEMRGAAYLTGLPATRVAGRCGGGYISCSVPYSSGQRTDKKRFVPSHSCAVLLR